jgi:hypothetical protein
MKIITINILWRKMMNDSFDEKNDLETLRELLIPGTGSDELAIPYIEGLNVSAGRLEKFEKYVMSQKQDKKNQLLLALIKKVLAS